MARIQVVGLVRFSVLTPDYYAERFGSMDAIAEHLFAPERLALRFRLFETLCLPSLVRQSDTGFRAAVLTSSRLPRAARERLADLLSPHRHLELIAAPPERQYRLLQKAYGRLRLSEAHSHCISFRLDDDDAVDLRFVERLKRQGSALLRLSGPDAQVMIAHNRGFYLEMRTDGENDVFDACERAPLSVGAALLGPMSRPGNPYAYNHRRFAQHYNLWSDLDHPAFLRSLHPDNKSRPAQLGLTRRLPPARVARQLRRHFGLDIELLRRLPAGPLAAAPLPARPAGG